MSDRDRQISVQHVRDANKRLAAENVRLAALVERLRMTPQEREAIERCADECEAEHYSRTATIEGFLDRHANGGAE